MVSGWVTFNCTLSDFSCNFSLACKIFNQKLQSYVTCNAFDPTCSKILDHWCPFYPEIPQNIVKHFRISQNLVKCGFHHKDKLFIIVSRGCSTCATSIWNHFIKHILVNRQRLDFGLFSKPLDSLRKYWNSLKITEIHSKYGRFDIFRAILKLD